MANAATTMNGDIVIKVVLIDSLADGRNANAVQVHRSLSSPGASDIYIQ
jgi:hypothetical protein